MRSDVRTPQACRSELVERIRPEATAAVLLRSPEEHAGFGASPAEHGTFNPFEDEERVRIRVFEGKNSLKGGVPKLLQAPHFLLQARERLRPPYEAGMKNQNGYRHVVLDALRAKHPAMI